MLETIQAYFQQHYEIFFLVMGVLFCIAAWCDWNWIFAPPYNSMKNPIGFWFGRKAMRASWMFSGLLIIALMVLVLYIQYSK